MGRQGQQRMEELRERVGQMVSTVLENHMKATEKRINMRCDESEHLCKMLSVANPSSPWPAALHDAQPTLCVNAGAYRSPMALTPQPWPKAHEEILASPAIERH